MRNLLKMVASLGVAAGLGAGCGQPDTIDTAGLGKRKREAILPAATRELRRAAALDQSGATETPPREYYEATFASALVKVDYDRYGLDDLEAPPLAWLSFDGGTVRRGSASGQSYLVCRDAATLPPSKLSPAERQEIVEGVQAALDRVGVAVRLAEEKPARGDYMTVHVGGIHEDLGCPPSEGAALGIAPFDVEDANKADVVFVFDETILGLDGATPSDVERQIATQLGRALGVREVAPLQAGGGRRIADAGGRDGSEDELSSGDRDRGGARERDDARASAAADGRGLALAGGGGVTGLGRVPAGLAKLPGLDQIAAIAQLLPGLDGQSLVAIDGIKPLLKGLLPAGVAGLRLPGLDKLLTVVGLVGSVASQPASQAGLVAAADAVPMMGAAASASPVDISQIGQLLGGNSGALASMPALLASGGFPNLSTAVDAAQVIIDLLSGGGKKPPAQGPLPSPQPSVPANLDGLPDLAGMLGLAEGANGSRPALINNLIGSARLVSGNFSGGEKDALMSLLKVAYSQAWQQLNGQSAP